MARNDVSDDDSDNMSVQMTSKGKENAPPPVAPAAVKRKKLAQLDVTQDDSLMAAEDEAPAARAPKPSATSSKARPTPSSSKPTASASSSKPSISSKPTTTKKTVPPPRAVDEEDANGDDSLMNEDEAKEDVFGEHDAAPAHKRAKPPKHQAHVSDTADKKGKGRPNGVNGAGEDREVGADVKSLLGRIKKLERTVYEITAERDAFEKERDTYSRQFDELSKIRETDAEKSFRSYREKAESRADKLNDLNKTLTSSLEKEKKERQRLIAAGPQAAAPVVPEPVPKELKDLERTAKEQRRQVKEQAELIEQLQRELKAEVANSRNLLKQSSAVSKATTSAVVATASAEEVTNDQRIAVFYEDLTNLAVVGIKFIKNDEAGGVLEPEFNCVYTFAKEGRSLNFKIRQANMFSPEMQAAGEKSPFSSVLVYQPLGLETESAEFVESLEFLASGFTTKWDKVNVFWKEIVARVGVEPEDEEEEAEEDE